MRNSLVALLFLSAAPIAAAKCTAQWIEVSGTVLDASENPAAGYAVGVSWTHDKAPSGPALAITDAAGNYAIAFEVPTDSGSSIFGDRCYAHLTTVSVSAYSGT